MRANTVTNVTNGFGIIATGTVTGNYANSNLNGISVASSQVFGTTQGSTVIGNTVTNSTLDGLTVDCPSNVTDNTAVNNGTNLLLTGTGCNNTNNVAP